MGRTVELAYDEIVRETDLAKCFDLGDQEAWIPKSVIEDDDGEGGGIVEVQEWFAEKEGLI